MTKSVPFQVVRSLALTMVLPLVMLAVLAVLAVEPSLAKTGYDIIIVWAVEAGDGPIGRAIDLIVFW